MLQLMNKEHISVTKIKRKAKENVFPQPETTKNNSTFEH
jgi:hypothetical protein